MEAIPDGKGRVGKHEARGARDRDQAVGPPRPEAPRPCLTCPDKAGNMLLLDERVVRCDAKYPDEPDLYLLESAIARST